LFRGPTWGKSKGHLKVFSSWGKLSTVNKKEDGDRCEVRGNQAWSGETWAPKFIKPGRDTTGTKSRRLRKRKRLGKRAGRTKRDTSPWSCGREEGETRNKK